MQEGFVLAVYVSQEVLRALGQVEDGLQVDYLGACLSNGGKRVGQQLQVA